MNSKYTVVFEQLLTEMFARVKLEYTQEYCQKKEWYLSKSWTIEEQNSFKAWAEKLLKTKFKWSKKTTTNEIAWFLFNYGWRIDNGDI